MPDVAEARRLAKVAEWRAGGAARGMKPYDKQAATDALAARAAAGYMPRYGGLTGERIAGALRQEHRRNPRLRRAVVLYRARTQRHRNVRLIAHGGTSRAPRARRVTSRSRARAPGREPEPPHLARRTRGGRR